MEKLLNIENLSNDVNVINQELAELLKLQYATNRAIQKRLSKLTQINNNTKKVQSARIESLEESVTFKDRELTNKQAKIIELTKKIRNR